MQENNFIFAEIYIEDIEDDFANKDINKGYAQKRNNND